MKRLTTYISHTKDLHSLNEYLNEKLIVNKNYNPYTCAPKSCEELREIIEQRYIEQGSGTAEEPIDFNDIDISNIVSFCNKNKEGIFEGIEFEYIDVSDWDVSKVKIMSFSFYKCDYLESVGDLSKWNVSNVEHMNSMFRECRSLTNVGDLSDWNVSKVRNITHMFTQCKKLKSIGDLSKWNISSVENMEDMFENSAITNIPNWYKS